VCLCEYIRAGSGNVYKYCGPTWMYTCGIRPGVMQRPAAASGLPTIAKKDTSTKRLRKPYAEVEPINGRREGTLAGIPVPNPGSTNTETGRVEPGLFPKSPSQAHASTCDCKSFIARRIQAIGTRRERIVQKRRSPMAEPLPNDETGMADVEVLHARLRAAMNSMADDPASVCYISSAR